MNIFFFQQKKIRNISKRGNSNRINRTSETTLRDKERGRERKKIWRRVKKFEHGRLSGRGGYAPARRDRAPFPSQRLNVDVSPRHYFFSFLFSSFLFFPPPPIPFPRCSLPSPWKSLAALTQSYAICVVRGTRVTRGKKSDRPRAKKRSPLPVPPVTLPPPSPNRCFAETHVANLATIFRFFPRVTRFRSQPDSG